MQFIINIHNFSDALNVTVKEKQLLNIVMFVVGKKLLKEWTI